MTRDPCWPQIKNYRGWHICLELLLTRGNSILLLKITLFAVKMGLLVPNSPELLLLCWSFKSSRWTVSLFSCDKPLKKWQRRPVRPFVLPCVMSYVKSGYVKGNKWGQVGSSRFNWCQGGSSWVKRDQKGLSGFVSGWVNVWVRGLVRGWLKCFHRECPQRFGVTAFTQRDWE